ncbi:hypothetical protein [Flagellimonas sp. 2504JD4-2]
MKVQSKNYGKSHLYKLMMVVLISFLNMHILSCQHKIPEAFKDFEKVYSKKLDAEYDEYNFWNGHWKVNWQTWQELDKYRSTGYAMHRVFSALDGKALIELAYSDSIVQGSKTAGFSIRYFDAALNKWVMLQSWPGKNSPNISSLKGTHHHGRIQLYQHRKTTKARKNVPVGTPYVNRYTFSDALPNSLRWDSSISLDSMRTWFTRSIAESNRIPDFDTLREANTDYWFTYGDGYNCDDTILDNIRPFLGEWEGETVYFEDGKKKTVKSSRVLMPFLSNCAVFGYQIIETEGISKKEIIFATYLPKTSEWVFYTLNNVKGDSQTLYFSRSLDKNGTTFNKKDLFGVESSNETKNIKWKINEESKFEINGYDTNGLLVFRRLMEKNPEE